MVQMLFRIKTVNTINWTLTTDPVRTGKASFYGRRAFGFGMETKKEKLSRLSKRPGFSASKQADTDGG